MKRLWKIAMRECVWMAKTPIYPFCMIIFPIVVMFLFTSMLNEGQPTEIPIGVVDQDNTAMTRSMVHKLEAFQSTKVFDYYPTVNDARKAIQRGEIYGFLYLPKNTTKDVYASRQPRIAYYYSNAIILAGSMVFKDLKTITSLSEAAVGSSKLQMLGKTTDEIKTFLQPIALDVHMINNPYSNYNVYLSTVMIPGVIGLFIFLITVYSIGTELKFGRGKEWMRLAKNNVVVAITGKILPQFLVFITIFLVYDWYLFCHLGFPHPGGFGTVMLLSLLMVLACEGFGIFAFGLMPSLRMSMSICSLWGVLGFSLSGATFPAFAMDTMLQGVANLIPMRHYWMIHQMCVFNGFPLYDAYFNIAALVIFACLPLLTMFNIRKAMQEYVYIP